MLWSGYVFFLGLDVSLGRGVRDWKTYILILLAVVRLGLALCLNKCSDLFNFVDIHAYFCRLGLLERSKGTLICINGVVVAEG